MRSDVFRYLLDVRDRLGAGYLLLIDPDRTQLRDIERLVRIAADSGVDAFLVGTSILMDDSVDEVIGTIKANADLPVILFPGSSHHLSGLADAVLFLSLISGRNPQFLIGEQVKAAPLIKKLGLEVISTGYMLIEGGSYTSVEFMSGTRPIPRDKIDIACAHALAGEFLGMKCLYLEAGSGAKHSVPNEMISAVKGWVNIPVIVGGGIRSPELAREKVKSGADFIVTGNIFEERFDSDLIGEFARAIHAAI
jgi:phosphoglycerol geranylgeranyltransferase